MYVNEDSYPSDTLLVEDTDLPILPRVNIIFSKSAIKFAKTLLTNQQIKQKSRGIKKNGRQLSYNHRINILHLNKVHRMSVNQISLMIKNHFLTVKKIVDEFDRDPDSLIQAGASSIEYQDKSALEGLHHNMPRVHAKIQRHDFKPAIPSFQMNIGPRPAAPRQQINRNRSPCRLLLIDNNKF